MENLLAMISSVMQRQKKRLQLRHTCAVERVWRSHLNYYMAQAHLAVFYQRLPQQHRGDLEQRFTHRDARYYSLLFHFFSLCNKRLTLNTNTKKQHFSD